jgi:FkbM family methyltransferase
MRGVDDANRNPEYHVSSEQQVGFRDDHIGVVNFDGGARPNLLTTADQYWLIMAKIQKAYSIWRDEGTLPLIQKTANWMYKQSAHWYYRQKGFQNLTIEGITAEFDTSNQEAIDKVRWMYTLEDEEVAQVLKELREDDVFFDIGANLGIYTAFASRKIKMGTVVAFEPYPPNVEILVKNAGRNGDNIDINEIALSDDWGTANFQQPDERVGSQIGALTPQGEATYKVDTAPVDGLISENEVPIPNVVKIDVEGAEPLVLEGMEEILANDTCRAVFCEIHLPTEYSRPSIQDFDSSAEELRDLLDSHGFDVRVKNTDRGENFLIAKRP